MRTKRGGFWWFRSKKSQSVANSREVNTKVIGDVDNSPNTSGSIIVSHNSRIQCLLGKLGVNPPGKIRFKNCCILKIVLTDIFVYIELIYSGDISDKDLHDDSKVFYESSQQIARDSNNKLVWFKPVMFDMDKKKMGLQNVELGKPYVFYLVRHGQSLHNETKTRGLVIDTPLTKNGQESAVKAESFLTGYLNTNTKYIITGYFVSDLYRTRETMNVFNVGGDHSQYVYVLPCASEVVSEGVNGDCDSSGGYLKQLARENYSSCSLDNIKDPLNKKCRADWSTYLKFYGNQIRGESNMFGTRLRCRDTNMLAMAIYILDFNKMPLESFMENDIRIVPDAINASESLPPLQTKPPPPPGAPPRENMEKTSGFFYGSYGGTKRTKLKRKRTRHRR